MQHDKLQVKGLKRSSSKVRLQFSVHSLLITFIHLAACPDSCLKFVFFLFLSWSSCLGPVRYFELHDGGLGHLPAVLQRHQEEVSAPQRSAVRLCLLSAQTQLKAGSCSTGLQHMSHADQKQQRKTDGALIRDWLLSGGCPPWRGILDPVTPLFH